MNLYNDLIIYDKNAYPYKRQRKVAYINSSGICNLKCKYCFTNNNKAPSSLNNNDIDYLFDFFGDNFLLCFSGQGDFFSGYKKKERFLENILSRNVGIYLDFNGTLVNEIFEIKSSMLSKILHFDVSFHYESMKEVGIIDKWIDHIASLSKIIDQNIWHVKTIMSMHHIDIWRKKIDIFSNKIYPKIKKPLRIVLDDFDNRVYSLQVIKLNNKIIKDYPDSVVQREFKPRSQTSPTTSESFLNCSGNKLMCPAGSIYFKVDIFGNVFPCNKIKNEWKVSIGNLKEKKVGFLTKLIPCSPLNGPGCLVNWDIKYLINKKITG